MTITVTDIGHNSNSSGATVGTTAPGGGIAAGSLVLVLVEEKNSSTLGTVTDAAGNTYVADTSRAYNSNNQVAAIFRSVIATGLNSGQAITYNKQTSGHKAGITAFFATSTTGWPASPLDSATTPTTGTSTTPSIGPSAAPTVANSLLAAALSWDGSGSAPPAYTQDTGDTAQVLGIEFR